METTNASGKDTIQLSVNTGFLRNPYTISVSFAIGVLLFFLPFAAIKCNDTKLATNTGFGLAAGQDWKNEMFGKNPFGYDDKEEGMSKDDMKKLNGKPSFFAIGALALGVIGLAFSLTRLPSKSRISAIAGLGAALMLAGLFIQLKTKLTGEMGKDEMAGLIKISFSIWFYLALLLFILAAYLSYQQHKVWEGEKNGEQLLKQIAEAEAEAKASNPDQPSPKDPAV